MSLVAALIICLQLLSVSGYESPSASVVIFCKDGGVLAVGSNVSV